jgi:hypothetical protein
MAVTLTTASTRIAANAAAVATAMAGGTTTAEATALAGLLAVLAARNDLSLPSLKLLSSTDAAQLGPT